MGGSSRSSRRRNRYAPTPLVQSPTLPQGLVDEYADAAVHRLKTRRHDHGVQPTARSVEKQSGRDVKITGNGADRTPVLNARAIDAERPSSAATSIVRHRPARQRVAACPRTQVPEGP